MNLPRPSAPPSRITWWEKIIFAVAGAALLASILGAAFGVLMVYTNSLRYLQPLSMDVEEVDGEWFAELTRLTPRGDVWAEWYMEATVEGELTTPCRAEGYTVFERVDADERIGRESNKVRFRMSESLRPCLEAARPVTIRSNYHVVMFGIRHRPAPLTVTLK